MSIIFDVKLILSECIPIILSNIVTDYLEIFKLRNWINKHYLQWDLLSENPNAIDLLERSR